jgi:predicted kinase
MSKQKEIIVMSGAQGSGKTTASIAIQQTHPGEYVRISRDELRVSLFGTHNVPQWEGIVTDAMFQLAQTFILVPVNIIIDDMNIFHQDVERWQQFARRYGYQLELKRMLTAEEECVRRDAEREWSVGRTAIKKSFAAMAGGK